MSFFNSKSENSEMKIIERDVGFVEDAFGMICDMVSFEDHCEGSFLSKEDDTSLKDKNWMRGMRSKYLDVVAKNCKGNDWCEVKHLCRVAKGLQELCARYLSVGKLEEAKKCAIDYGEVYIKFLEKTGYTKGEISNTSSA